MLRVLVFLSCATALIAFRPLPVSDYCLYLIHDLSWKWFQDVISALELESTQRSQDVGGNFWIQMWNNLPLIQSAIGGGAQSMLEVEEGQDDGTIAAVEGQSSTDKTECYSLCLNPTVNTGCQAAADVVALLQTFEIVSQDTKF